MADQTPLTRLQSLSSGGKGVYAKHEYGNPTGSIKDRMVGSALRRALDAGELRAGQTIVEASSGNTGAAIAYAARELGCPVEIFVSQHVSVEKIAMIQKFGGRVTAVDPHGKAEIECAADRAQEIDGYLFNQFENKYHVPGYKETVAAELLEQLKALDVLLDHCVIGVGSGGSVRAVGEVLREHHNANVKIWGVVPCVYPSDIEGLNPGHLRKEGHFAIWNERDEGFESGLFEVKDEDAYAECLALQANEGLLVGPASGACLFAARNLPENGNVLVLLTDTGTKYGKKLADYAVRIDYIRSGC